MGGGVGGGQGAASERDTIPTQPVATRTLARRHARWLGPAKCPGTGVKEPHQQDPDRSRADYVWSKTALEWGIRSGRPWSDEEVAARLLQESEKARDRGEDYALQTVRAAAAAVERERAQAR